MTNLSYNVYKNDCFLNIFCLLGAFWKKKLQIQIAGLKVIYKMIDLYYLKPVQEGLHKAVVR